MKIRNASRKFKTWISALWSPPRHDWLEAHYELLADDISAEVDDEMRLELLTKARDKNIKQKKKHTHIQREIEFIMRKKLANETKRNA